MINKLKNIESWFKTESLLKVTMRSFEYFYDNVKLLEEYGLQFFNKEDDLIYYFKNDKETVQLSILDGKETFETRMPDYTRSMVNLTSSISSYYNKDTSYSTLKELDSLLIEKKPKHLFFLILDGLAPYIMDKCLTKEDFLQKYKVSNISAVYPSTTACSIPCSVSGKLSVETGWLGWENYFEDINMDLVLFTGINYKTGNPTGINVREKYLPYDDYYASFTNVKTFDLEPSFKPNGFEKFPDMVDKMIEISNLEEDTFAYCYWDEPDGTLHGEGCDSDKSFDVIRDLSKVLDSKKDKFNKDTLIIITADHGHTNVKPIYLNEFEDIMNMLSRTPSNEGRCLCFSVKKDYNDAFVDLFNRYFSSLYDLYSKKDFIEKGFLSDSKHRTINKHLNSFLGDYIAVAKSNYYFVYLEKGYVFKSAHAGLTKNEMETPLIIFTK